MKQLLSRPHFLSAPWLRAVWFRGRYCLSGLVLLLPLSVFPLYFQQVTTPPLGAMILPEREVGPFRVTLAEYLSGPPLPGRNGYLFKDYKLAIKDGYPGRIRSAYLRQDAPISRDLGDILHGDPYRLHAHVRIEGQPAATDRLWLTLEEWDGTLHQTSWPFAEVMSDVVFPDQDQKK